MTAAILRQDVLQVEGDILRQVHAQQQPLSVQQGGVYVIVILMICHKKSLSFPQKRWRATVIPAGAAPRRAGWPQPPRRSGS